MLTKWRVLTMCQYLLGGHVGELEEACVAALEAFAAQGPSTACDKAFETAGIVIKRVERVTETVLPSIPKEKRIAVSRHLDSLGQDGASAFDRALGAVPSVRERMH